MTPPLDTLVQPAGTLAGVTVDVVVDERGFDALQPEWQVLLDGTGSWNPFLTFAWMRSWWSHLRSTAALHIVVVRTQGEVIAIAPLMIVRRGHVAPRRLELISTGSGADYLDVIVKPGSHAAALPALAAALDAQQMPLHLDNLPPDAAVNNLVQRLTATGWSALDSSPDVCPFIDLSGGSWDAYLSSLGAAHRANVRRRMRALQREHDVRFAVVSTQEQRRQALEALFEFHDQRWRGGSTAFSGAAQRAFHHDVTRRAFDAGWLRMFDLRLDGRLAGVMYGFARDGRFYFFQHGTDAAFASSSLGLVVMALTIRAAIDEGLHEFDMLYGHEAYKALWTRRQRPLGRLMLFPPRLMGRWLQAHAETRLALRALAHRVGVKGTHDAA